MNEVTLRSREQSKYCVMRLLRQPNQQRARRRLQRATGPADQASEHEIGALERPANSAPPAPAARP